MDGQSEEPLYCGRCGIRVDVSKDGDGVENVRCEACGESDTLLVAKREAGAHLAHQFLRQVILKLPREQACHVFYRFVEKPSPGPALSPMQ